MMPHAPRPMPSLPANPYVDDSANVAMHSAVPQRPGGLTVLGVLCIVGGIVGLLSGVFGIISLFFGAAMSSAFIPAGPQQQVQQEMNIKIQEVASTFLIPNVIIIVGTIVLCSGLLAGGIGVFGQRPRGRTLLIRVFLLAMILEFLRGALYVATQLQMLPITAEYMSKLISNGSSDPSSAPVIGTMMRVMTFVTMGLWLIWGVAKIGLFAWGRSYLKKPHTIDHFRA